MACVARPGRLLTDEISQANFAFYGTVLTGTPVQRDRWKRGLDLADGYVGQEIGQTVCGRAFPGKFKNRNGGVGGLPGQGLPRTDQPVAVDDPATRERALEKLAKFQAKIGYPDKWRDYTGLEFESDGSALVETCAGVPHSYTTMS